MNELYRNDMMYSWAIILCHLFVLLFGWVVFGVIVRRAYLKKKRLSWFTGFLEFLVFALYANLFYCFQPVLWPELPAMPTGFQKWIGLALSISGAGLTIWGMILLGFQNTFGQSPGTLCRKGLYRYSRNPQIVAFAILLAGVLVLWPSWWGILWLSTYGLIAHIMVRSEEAYLHLVHPDAYAKYCNAVPRYLCKLTL